MSTLAESAGSSATSSAAPERPADDVGPTAERQRRPRAGVAVWGSVLWLGGLGAVLVLTPVLPLADPDRVSADLYLRPASPGHLLGTDEIGRDLLARVLWGGRVSLGIGICATVLGFVVGGALGVTAGFVRGRYERVVVAVLDVMVSFPPLVLAMALLRMLSEAGTMEGSFGKVVLVLTVLSVPAVARISRANTLTFAQSEFVVAAESIGARPRRILCREILPNVLPSMLSFSFLAIAVLVVAEGGLAFLGLSVQSPAATWGKLIEVGQRDLDSAPYLTFVPCVFLFLTLLSLNVIGDRLQSRLAIGRASVT